MTSLLINIDHVATLRNARGESFPDPANAAMTVEKAGADGVVFHLREDRRHITDRDVWKLKEVVVGKLDFELSINAEIVKICCDCQPNLATLVPERRAEITTEGGLNVLKQKHHLKDVIHQLYEAGIPEVALFVDPVLDQIEASRDVGANCIELHTGDFANATDDSQKMETIQKLRAAAQKANSIGLQIHAGHGLDYNNYLIFKSQVTPVHEVSIGFSVIARALFSGLESAVSSMLQLVKGPDHS